jgi:hypothetical protein
LITKFLLRKPCQKKRSFHSAGNHQEANLIEKLRIVPRDFDENVEVFLTGT